MTGSILILQAVADDKNAISAYLADLVVAKFAFPKHCAGVNYTLA